ncbi:exonuclease domain-containing protein [Streptomyces pseudovenezuelae]|uniref:exonuclease domain-containing protein n=1 Tax=Streptomyces pseudovenezuelae TaxID=67350 RepID=UPI0036E49D1C
MAQASGAATAAEDSDRIARGEPRGYIGGVPVYWWGQAPPYLRTQPQLNRKRLKLAEGQQPLAYVHTREWGDVGLYDPAEAVKMKPLASSVKARVEARRTCPRCGKVREFIVRNGRCGVCEKRDYEARLRLAARTCRGCASVRERPYPAAHGRCQDCRRAQLAEERARQERQLVHAITCAGRDCSARVASKAEFRRWRKSHPYGSWAPRWCPPCAERRERERAEEVERARLAEEERRMAVREARRREVAGLEEWAAAALADELVCVLDTETTGKDGDARVVEVAVYSVHGEVLLDSLVNPGCSIPAEATGIHGITDSMVSAAPSFGELLGALAQALDGRRCLIYNDVFDVGRLRYELDRHYRAVGHEDPAAAAEAWLAAQTFADVMVPYSDWVGEPLDRWEARWGEYWGPYAWQKLPGGDHRALGDCRAVLDVLRQMARHGAAEDETDAAVGGHDCEGEG